MSVKHSHTTRSGETGRSSSGGKSTLRLLSYNIQVAVASSRLRHYVTQSWKHFLPHPHSLINLDRISDITCQYDIVALQEVDAGSLRSQFVNQIQYLADKGHFPYWYYQTNRNLGKFAQHSNGLLSHLKPASITEHKLPGLLPGRGAIMVRYGHSENPLILLLVHLALGRRARLSQLAYISEIANQYQHVILMGDLNCQPESQEIRSLLENTDLSPPLAEDVTFPSWRPVKKLDYIMASRSLEIERTEVISHAVSDHLPLAMEIRVPNSVQLFG